MKLKIRNIISVSTLNYYKGLMKAKHIKYYNSKMLTILQQNWNIIKTKYTNIDKTHSFVKYQSERKQTLL